MILHSRLLKTIPVAFAAVTLGWNACAQNAATELELDVRAVHASPGLADNSKDERWCRVSGDVVNIRVAPNTSNQPVTTLRSGDYVRARAVQNDWLEIAWPQNVYPWVLKDTIQVSASDSKSGSVRSARARLMSQGMSTAPEVAKLERGVAVSIVAEKGDWYQVKAPAGARAYINAKYVMIDVEPIAEAVELPKATRVNKPSSIKREIWGKPDSEVIEVGVLQKEAAWPKSVVPSAAAKKVVAEPIAKFGHATAEPTKPAVATAVKPEAPAAKPVVAVAPPVEPAKVALPEPVVAPVAAAPAPKTESTQARVPTVTLKVGLPLILNDADLHRNGQEPNENNYVAPYAAKETAVVVSTPAAPAPVAVAPKIVSGPAAVDVDDANFGAEVDGYKGAVLIDFAATWCGPCQRTMPQVEALAEEFRGRVKVAKIDLDRAPQLARRFDVSSIPCLIMLQDGKVVNRQVGVPPQGLLRSWMQNAK